MSIKKRNKFNAKRGEYNGMKFDSKGELQRYLFLKAAQERGEISNLKRQVPYKMAVKGKLICTYKADHVYTDTNGNEIIEDFKGMPPQPIFKLKMKLLKALHNIDVKIVRKFNEKIN